MLNIGFFKAQPGEYVIKYVSGKIAREGSGLAFYYLKYNTQIVAVPTTSTDGAFVFNEVSNNFQAVTIQGQFTYFISNARQAASLLNFTIEPQRRTYISSDPERLPQRITNVIQMETRGEIQSRSLEDTLRDAQQIAATVFARIRDNGLLEPLGVQLLNVYFQAVRPTPEVAKALEAQYRETLLRQADEAIYARRAAAVEEERKIKENELHTDITLAQRRQELIELEGANAQQEAEFRGLAFEREAEHRSRATATELAVYNQGADPKLVLALALKEIGSNAKRINNLTITTEMLGALLNETSSAKAARETNEESPAARH